MSPLATGGGSRYSFELALDRYVCYPMETAVLTVKAKLTNPARTLLCIHIPKNLEIEWIRMDEAGVTDLSVYSTEYDGKVLTIPLAKYLDPGSEAEILICVRLHSLRINHYVSFCAWMAADLPDRNEGLFKEPRGSRSIDLAVKSNAGYMRFLPEVYSYDDFINRFLMMFESFWKPVDQQISQVENYFDPDLTPEAFLPWLASWVGMEIDPSFPKNRIRELIRCAIPLSHSRGTAQSVKLFLEMYSGGKAEISEKKAQNMIVGGVMGLGDGIALGVDNKPNTVSVRLTAPKSELERTGFTKEKYTKKIGEFVRSMVPAHTVFTVSCKFE